jgi:tetraacyldisaccharide-1-P 4'-kinase
MAIVTTEKDAVKLGADAIMPGAAQNGASHSYAIVAIAATFEVEPDVLERILAVIR